MYFVEDTIRVFHWAVGPSKAYCSGFTKHCSPLGKPRYCITENVNYSDLKLQPPNQNELLINDIEAIKVHDRG